LTRQPSGQNHGLYIIIASRPVCGGAEFAGPENDGPKKIEDWNMQDLENARPFLRFCIFQPCDFVIFQILHCPGAAFSVAP